MYIDDINNWKLRIRREDSHVVILSALTCDVRASLPRELFGLPVTELGDHALSHGPDFSEGEPVELTCGPFPDNGWDNRRMEELNFPDTLERVGNYALYRCRALRTLQLSDRTLDWGSGAFTACDALGRFIINGSGNEGRLLHYLTRELSRELDITLQCHGTKVGRLVFPEYMEFYEENCPAHLFNRKVYGAGLGYHHIFTGGSLNFAAYDGLWRDFLSRAHEQKCALRLAWYRLRLPIGLARQAKEDYLNYICTHAVETGQWLIAQRDGTGLCSLLNWVELDDHLLSRLGEEARTSGFTEAQVLLLEAHRKRPPARLNRNFEL